MTDYDDSPLKPEELLLQKFYGHVKSHGGDVYLTQPGMAEGVVEYTFQEVYDKAGTCFALVSFEMHFAGGRN